MKLFSRFDIHFSFTSSDWSLAISSKQINSQTYICMFIHLLAILAIYLALDLKMINASLITSILRIFMQKGTNLSILNLNNQRLGRLKVHVINQKRVLYWWGKSYKKNLIFEWPVTLNSRLSLLRFGHFIQFNSKNRFPVIVWWLKNDSPYIVHTPHIIRE